MNTPFPLYANDLPYLTTEQMVEVDRAMIEDFHIELTQMMENAGRNLATVAKKRFLNNSPQEKRVAILAGTGGNGGGAIVSARRLHNWGAEVHIFITKDATEFKSVPAHQLDIAQRMRLNIASDALPADAMFDLVIDGLIGYSLRGAPRGRAADLISWANRQSVPILSLDAPSGIDTTLGTDYEPSISATATMTLALPKEGLRASGVVGQVGELYLADISIPPQLYAIPSLGMSVGPIFAQSDIVRLH